MYDLKENYELNHLTANRARKQCLVIYFLPRPVPLEIILINFVNLWTTLSGSVYLTAALDPEQLNNKPATTLLRTYFEAHLSQTSSHLIRH
jgi:hypothetical protein